MYGAAEASSVRCVRKRGAFNENMKPSGVSSCHFLKLAGLWMR